MASWVELLTRADPGSHLAQAYGDDDHSLARNVSRYLAEGLRRGDGLVVIATPEHTRAVARHLVEEQVAVGEAIATGRLRHLDAAETLASLLVDDRVDESRFESVVVGTLGAARERSRSGRVRAFGEVVSLLWGQDRPAQAARLEELWNSVLDEGGCSLYCAYRFDLFDPGRDAAELQSIVCAHHHLLAGSGTLISSGRPLG